MTAIRCPLVTPTVIAAAEPGQWIWEDATPGLGLRAGKLRPTWYFRKQFAGKRLSIKLGGYPALSPGAARSIAAEMDAAMCRGQDPRQHVHRADIALDDLIERWIADKPTSAQFRTKYARSIRKHCAGLLAVPIVHVTAPGLSEIVENLREGKPATARDLVRRLASVFKFAVDTGLLAVSPTVRLDRGKAGIRERTPTLTEMRTIWAGCEQWPEAYRTFTRLVMILGFRRAEAAKLRWQDLDKPGRRLTIRGTTSKTGAAVVSPVPVVVMEELERLKAGTTGPLIERNGHALKDADLQEINARLRKLFPNDPIRLHDFRRALATHCAEQGWPQEVVDAQLNHLRSASSNAVTAAYFKTEQLDRRRQMLEQYATAVAEVARKVAKA